METQDDHVPRSDQWSTTVSAHRALLLFVAVVAAAVGLCAFAALRKKKRQILHKQQVVDVEAGTSVSPNVGNNLRVLQEEATEEEKLQLAADKGSIAAAGAVVSPVWQRRILMGERCELPRFSGLILYNEQGLPIHHNTSNKDNLPTQLQEKPSVVLTTLRDLL